MYETHFACHDILMLGKSPIKWRQRPDMTIAVDWDARKASNQIKLSECFTLCCMDTYQVLSSVCTKRIFKGIFYTNCTRLNLSQIEFYTV